jgi:hypothetical protein
MNTRAPCAAAAVAAVTAVTAVTIVACQSLPVEPSHLARKNELTEAERKYGVAPRRDRSITYQPDVVIVKGGADIVRSASPDGLTWTIDPRAPGAADIAVGRIMFVTGRAVGRVLALRRATEGLAVTVGPVDLPEIVRDLDFQMNQPLDLDQAIQYEAPRRLAVSTVARVFKPTDAIPAPVVYRPEQSRFLMRPTGVTAGRFNVGPYAGKHGVGLTATSDAGGVRLFAGALLVIDQPTIRADIQIHNGIRKAEIALSGATRWSLEFSVASEVGLSGNFNEEIPVPVDWSVPMTGPAAGFPFAVTVRHVFIAKTAFTSQGNLKVAGSLNASGALSAGYSDGKFRLGGPTLTVERSFLQSMKGVSIGPTGIVIAHEVRVIVGVGAFDFVTGPYAGLRTALGVTQGSSIGIIRCKGGTIDSHVTAGVGYSIPQLATNAINLILRALNAQPIKGHGVIEGGTLPLFHVDAQPQAKPCKG